LPASPPLSAPPTAPGPARLPVPRLGLGGPPPSPSLSRRPAEAPLALSGAGVAHLVGMATAAAGAALSAPGVAQAAEDLENLPYNNEAGSMIFETLGGVFYTGLLIFFFIRLFTKVSVRGEGGAGRDGT